MAKRWVELRVGIDRDDVPLAQVYGDQMTIAVGDDQGVVAELLVPLEAARAWAGELFWAVVEAHRDAAGDPHGLSEEDLADLADPHAYRPGSSLALVGDESGPARMGFHILLTVEGQALEDGALRAALVEHLAGRFNLADIAVSAGQAVAGKRS
jgi:hypothetical protein